MQVWRPVRGSVTQPQRDEIQTGQHHGCIVSSSCYVGQVRPHSTRAVWLHSCVGGMWNCAVLCINYIPFVIKDVPATWTQSLKSFPGKCFTALMHVWNTEIHTWTCTETGTYTQQPYTSLSSEERRKAHLAPQFIRPEVTWWPNQTRELHRGSLTGSSLSWISAESWTQSQQDASRHKLCHPSPPGRYLIPGMHISFIFLKNYSVIH